jgi:hypothetical protein
MTKNGGNNWLRDRPHDRPHDLPNARILSWGYDANTHISSSVSSQHLYDHGRGLVSDLCLHRQLTEVRDARGTMYNSKN